MAYEEIIRDFPRKISNNIKTVEYISLLWHNLKNKKGKKIVIDISNTFWIDSNMCAALGVILEEIKQNNKVVFRGASQKLVKVLTNNRFLSQIDVDNSNNYKSPYITYEKFWVKQKEEYEMYLLEQVPKFLNNRLSDRDIKAFIQILLEMLVNIKMHTNSCFATSSGVYFPESKQMYFTICNHGITISENIEKKNGYIFSSDKEAIAWAVKRNNSTRKEDEVGGLGFYITREFVQKYGGAMWVISGGGYWKEEGSRVEMCEMRNLFPGTIVTIKLDLNVIKDVLNEEGIDEEEVISIDELVGEVI